MTFQHSSKVLFYKLPLLIKLSLIYTILKYIFTCRSHSSQSLLKFIIYLGNLINNLIKVILLNFVISHNLILLLFLII